MKDPHDAVARSDALDAELEGNPVVMNLVKISRQHGLLLKVLIGSLLFDFALSGAIFFLTVKSSHTADQANQAAKTATSAQTQAYNQCLASNDSRHTQLQLWEFILALPPDPNLSPPEQQRQQAEAATFRRYVRKKLASRDCSHLKPVRASDGTLRFLPLPLKSTVTTPPQAPESPGTAPEAAPEPTPRPAERPSPGHHPSTQPSPSPSPSPHPSSSPTPLVCIVGHCIRNPLPPSPAAASPGPGSVPVAVAGGLLLLVSPCWLNCWRKSRVSHPGREQEHAGERQGRRRHDPSMQHPASS